jgi:N-methylhydantoinase B
MHTSGGGGFGDPAKRKPERIERDIARGYYTREQAKARFGNGRAGK